MLLLLFSVLRWLGVLVMRLLVMLLSWVVMGDCLFFSLRSLLVVLVLIVFW